MKNKNKRIVFVGKAKDLMAYLAHFKIVNGSFEVDKIINNFSIDVC